MILVNMNCGSTVKQCPNKALHRTAKSCAARTSLCSFCLPVSLVVRFPGAMTEQMQIPDPPKFSDDQIKKCRDSGDFMPMLFEWYKFVGHLCIFFALIMSESPAVREFPPIQYSVLTGLLNRCARLMLADSLWTSLPMKSILDFVMSTSGPVIEWVTPRIVWLWQ